MSMNKERIMAQIRGRAPDAVRQVSLKCWWSIKTELLNCDPPFNFEKIVKNEILYNFRHVQLTWSFTGVNKLIAVFSIADFSVKEKYSFIYDEDKDKFCFFS